MILIKVESRQGKWQVYGPDGGVFTNLSDAKQCAKECSMDQEYYKGEAVVWLISDGCNYITYRNGKCVRDDWTRSNK